jgi:hypothetical protein
VGGGLAVRVGSITRVGAVPVKNVKLPHPIDRSVKNEIKAQALLKPIKDD